MGRLIDVVVPMYNRVQCIENIVDELEKQTFKDFRVIFVDDGSTDNTYEVLIQRLKTAAFDYCVIKKENGGAGSARNAGMQAANTQWISFVDSDDGLSPNFLKYMLLAAEETRADLAICNLKMFPEGEKAVNEPLDNLSYKVLSAADTMKLYCQKWFGPVCLLIKKSMQREHNLYFDEECIFNEDAPYIADVIAAAHRVVHIDQTLYYYYTHNGSLHRSPRLDKYFSAIKSFAAMEEKMAKNPGAAATVFNSRGGARFYIATLRRGAVQLPYRDFCLLAEKIDFKRYRNQVKQLLPAQRMACYLMLCSKRLFYHGMRVLFRD